MFGVNAHTQYLGVKILEKPQVGFQIRDLLASGTCPIQWIEDKHYIHQFFVIFQRIILIQVLMQEIYYFIQN